jgi:hypothetical protein
MSTEFGEYDIGDAVDSPDSSGVFDDIAEVSDVPEIPDVPDVTDVPDLPLEPEVVDIAEPEIIEEPEVIDEPEIVDEGEIYDIEGPEVIGEPEIIEEPIAPEELEPQEEPIAQTDEPEIQEAVEAIGSMDNLNPGTWDSLGAQERLETLQNVENTMAEIQGRPAVEIIADDTLNPSTFGGYNPNTETITINAAHLNSDMPVDEYIDTVVHEGRHAYQDHAIKNPGFVNQTDLVNSWAENQSNYLTADQYGQEIYATQPVEADAWDYATRIRNNLIAHNWS